ncbi:MAG: hypothetical protein AB7I48_07605, partial [Planctomycetaceae bacterium]
MLNQILTPPDAAAVAFFRNIDARQMMRLDGVTWEQYVAVADAFPDRPALRITFDGERLELMTTSAPHERYKKYLGRLNETQTNEQEIDIVSGGNTTYRREDINRGLEPDECYREANEPAMRHL